MSRLVVITRDLMDAERFRAAVPEVCVVRKPDSHDLATAETILLDLASGIDPAAVAAIGPPVVAYGAHVDQTVLDEAVAAGCVEAVPRSRVFRRAGELLD